VWKYFHTLLLWWKHFHHRRPGFAFVAWGNVSRLLRLEEQWREVAFYVQAVDDLLAYLEQIKPDYKRLVELYFFEGKQAWQVAEELAIGERTMYHWLRDITRLFAHRLGLCSAG